MILSFNQVQGSGQCRTATKWQSKNSSLALYKYIHALYLQHKVSRKRVNCNCGAAGARRFPTVKRCSCTRSRLPRTCATVPENYNSQAPPPRTADGNGLSAQPPGSCSPARNLTSARPRFPPGTRCPSLLRGRKALAERASRGRPGCASAAPCLSAPEKGGGGALEAETQAEP